MHLERPRPAVLRVTLSTFEMATLIAAARWALEGGEGELEPAARAQLEQVIASWDDASSAFARD